MSKRNFENIDEFISRLAVKKPTQIKHKKKKLRVTYCIYEGKKLVAQGGDCVAVLE